ncbi:glycosyltransferase family 39 protein [Thermodesulfobacteriota bacterium]
MGSPAIFFTYALMFKLFGQTMAAIPMTDIIVSMVTTFLIYLLAKFIWGTKFGFVSALFFAIFSSGVRLGMHSAGDIAFGTFWYIAQRETFMLPLIVASIYLTISAVKFESKVWKLTLAGFLGGLAFVYKFPSLIFFACIMGYLSWSIFSSKDRVMVKHIVSKNLALISGFVLALIPFILFFSIKGALFDMTDIIFGYVYSVYGKLSHDTLTVISTGLRRTFFLAQENFILWIFFISAPIYVVLNDRTKENLLVVAWGFASVFYIISHKEFFGYHYLMILPPFSVLAGYGIIKAIGPKLNFRQILTIETGKVIIIFVVLANLFTFITIVHPHYTKFLFYLTGKITKNQYYDYFNAYPKHDYSFPADYMAAQYILKNTDPDDLIYSLGGIESVIYFLTKRKSPSRFIFSWILFYYAHGQTKEAVEYREELLGNLKTKTPKYIITVRSLETFKPFENIYKFINSNYYLEKTFPDDRFVYAFKNNSKK